MILLSVSLVISVRSVICTVNLCCSFLSKLNMKAILIDLIIIQGVWKLTIMPGIHS